MQTRPMSLTITVVNGDWTGRPVNQEQNGKKWTRRPRKSRSAFPVRILLHQDIALLPTADMHTALHFEVITSRSPGWRQHDMPRRWPFRSFPAVIMRYRGARQMTGSRALKSNDRRRTSTAKTLNRDEYSVTMHGVILNQLRKRRRGLM